MAFSRVVFILVCLCASVSGSEHDATPAQPLMETDFESLVRTYVKVEHHNSLLGTSVFQHSWSILTRRWQTLLIL